MRTKYDSPHQDSQDVTSLHRLSARSQRLADTLRTTEALIRGKRQVDLAGLDAQMAELCAQALTLASGERALLRPQLQSLLGRLDALLAALAAAAPTPVEA